MHCVNLTFADISRSTMSQVNGRLEILAASFQAITVEQRSDQIVSQIVSQNCLGSAEVMTTESKPLLNARLSPVTELVFKSSGEVQTRTMQRSLDVGLGLLSLQTTVKSLKTCDAYDGKEKDAKPTRKSFTVRFLCRFATCRRGFRVCTNDTFDNWTFNTIRRRPWDSKIFDLCTVGDVEGVKKLIHYGEASVFDVTQEGWSLLHARTLHMNRFQYIN